MASHVVVIDTSFRRTTIKVTPGKYLTDVLEEACAKFGIKSSNYALKNKDKPIDLSRTFRQTGLSSGAKLELVVSSRTPTAVSVALQLPASLASTAPNGRLTDKFPSDTTLWLILRKFESSGGMNLNFTARGITEVENGKSGAGRIFYEMPTLNVMGRELSTFGDLQKNLAQLGFNGGSCLIRLDFKKTNQPLEEAMAEIGQYFKEDAPEKDVPAGAAPAPAVDTVSAAIANLPDVPSGQDVEMTSSDAVENQLATASLTSTSKRPAAEISSEILGPGQRPISVFSPPTNVQPRAATIVDDASDYEPTIAHAKLHQLRLQNNSQNKRLQSDAEIEQQEQERAARLAKAKEVKVRIRFPDQSSIESIFNAEDTGATLYTFAAGVIIAENQPFKLGWNSNKGPQAVPKNEQKLIRDLGFQARVMVNFSWDDGASDAARKGTVLKPQYIEKAKEIPVPEVPKEEAKEDDRMPTIDKGKGKETEGGGKPKGIPKWLKLPGKK